MTLQKVLAPPKALHEPGSAAPKVVQTPLPPSAIEHLLVPVWNAEQFLAGPGCPFFVEQKLRSALPWFSTEQVAVFWLPALQMSSPCPFTEHCERPFELRAAQLKA